MAGYRHREGRGPSKLQFAALAALPFYMQPFVWSLAAVAAGLAAIITYMNKAAH